MPKSLVHGSVIPGLMTLSFCGVCQAGTFIMLAFLCSRVKAKNYPEMMGKTIGPRAKVGVNACIALSSFFSGTAYLVLMADFFQKSLEGLFAWRDVPRTTLIWAFGLADVSHLPSPPCHGSTTNVSIMCNWTPFCWTDRWKPFRARVEFNFSLSLYLFEGLEVNSRKVEENTTTKTHKLPCELDVGSAEITNSLEYQSNHTRN